MLLCVWHTLEESSNNKSESLALARRCTGSHQLTVALPVALAVALCHWHTHKSKVNDAVAVNFKLNFKFKWKPEAWLLGQPARHWQEVQY